MRSLLDVNVLIALVDADHIHHDRAHAWFAEHAAGGWATCAITENGFARILSQPAYPNSVDPAVAIHLLRRACDRPDHEFWPSDLTIRDGKRLAEDRIHGGRQLTDAYLLALAVARGGRLVTLDHSVPLSAVPGSRAEHLTVL